MKTNKPKRNVAPKPTNFRKRPRHLPKRAIEGYFLKDRDTTCKCYHARSWHFDYGFEIRRTGEMVMGERHGGACRICKCKGFCLPNFEGYRDIGYKMKVSE